MTKWQYWNWNIKSLAKLDVNIDGEPETIKMISFDNTINSMNAALRLTWYNDTADFGMIRSG